MNISDLTVNVRILVKGGSVAIWRVRLLGLCARLLGVPLDTDSGAVNARPTVTVRAADTEAVIREIGRMAARQNPQTYTAFNAL